MQPIEIRDLPEVLVVSLAHRGSYLQIGETFGKLAAWAGPRGVFNEQTRVIGIFYDNPDNTPADELRAEACFSAPAGIESEGDVGVKTIPGGKHAVVTYRGPYTGLPKVYRWLYGEWLLNSGEQLRPMPSYENYLNNPLETAPEELITEICLPLV